MKKLFKWVFGNKKNELKKRSAISTYYGDRFEIERAYKNLEHKEDVNITSVSVTRVDNGGGCGYIDKYLIVVSYDYYPKIKNND